MASDPPRIVALVPMRHSSERVRGKNYRPLGGIPLFHHVLDALASCALVDEIVIDTDSDLIKADVRATYSEQVRLIDRPEELRGGHVPMTDVLRHDVAVVAADLYIQTHSTNPFLRSETITDALELFLQRRDDHDSLFSVTPLQTRLWSPQGKALNHDPSELLRTQDLEPVMEENSCIYVFDAATLEVIGSRIGHRPILFPTDPVESWDIDDEVDWRIAEALYALKQEEVAR